MANTKEIKVPDIGDFENVDVIDVMVAEGDKIEKETALITLETDKAAMDVPSPYAGTIKSLKVATDDKVSEGDVIAIVEVAEEEPATEEAAPEKEPEKAPDEAPEEPPKQPKDEPKTESKPQQADEYKGDVDIECDVLVLGSGPGGYTAAFRAADLGQKTVLVERYDSLGGVCLNVGCIPSKALLHVAKVIEETHFFADHGVKFGEPDVDADKLREWKNSVVNKLTGGLDGLAKRRKIEVVHGVGQFVSPHHVEVEGTGGKKVVRFEKAIIAAGSEAAMLPNLPDDDRIMTSTEALELDELPERMLVIGGGIIGLEMATVYSSLGVKVSVVEMTGSLMPGADRAIVKPLEKRISNHYEKILLNTKVSKVEATKQGIKVSFEGKDAPKPQTYGRVLVAVGRRPNGGRIGADKAGVKVDERGFISTDKQQRTNVEHIFAIGDITKEPLLAHKASHEGKVAAEVAAGEKSAFDARVIPSVAYTDPEIAWVGLTEAQAKEQGVDLGVGEFPWAANGRSLAMGRDDGLTRIYVDKKDGRIVGAGIVGPGAGDLISEIALAIEMGADAADVALTIHPHPTTSETVAMAAEAYEGTLTDLYVPKKK
ncbi:MAG TPA: dihydrolipoyl dehydrogenase [Gammaproteobacteria bacterium]|nr:dihydrolipoyl dehydrogenase [Gammaproteobacteria bacterium]